MTDNPSLDDETGGGRQAPTPTAGMPRWVKAFLVTAAALILLMVVIMLITGGQHGPSRHQSSTGLAGTALQRSVPDSDGRR